MLYGCFYRSGRIMRAQYTWGLPIRKLKIIIFMASCPPHMRHLSICAFSSPLYASIWLKFWPCWVAWLLCLCPMFPLIRLGHKGSTSAIVTTGSAGCVPQTRWSRKLAFLREYSVGEQKMFLSFITTWITRCFVSCVSVRGSYMHIDACVPRERNP